MHNIRKTSQHTVIQRIKRIKLEQNYGGFLGDEVIGRHNHDYQDVKYFYYNYYYNFMTYPVGALGGWVSGRRNHSMSMDDSLCELARSSSNKHYQNHRDESFFTKSHFP